MTALKQLSDVASPGKLYPRYSRGHGFYGRASQPDDDPTLWTVTRYPNEDGWETDSGCNGYGISEQDARFLAELWNAYRDGRLVEREL